MVQGDSSLCLHQSIKDIDCRMTFWLDGHYSGGDTAISATKQISPLLEKLDQIKSHHRKDHIILIDDMRLWVKEDSFGSDEIIKKIHGINPNYVISYEDDVCAEKDILIARII